MSFGEVSVMSVGVINVSRVTHDEKRSGNADQDYECGSSLGFVVHLLYFLPRPSWMRCIVGGPTRLFFFLLNNFSHRTFLHILPPLIGY